MNEQGKPHMSAGIARTITALDAELRALVDADKLDSALAEVKRLHTNTPMSLTQALRHVIRNHQVTA